jgi:hypothetical protein
MANLNQGYAPPPATPSVPAVAPLIRVAAVSSSVSSYELPVKSRSVIDQNNLPCCVSSALGAATEIMNPNWPAVAPLFHYYVARYNDGQADDRGFLYLSGGLQTLTIRGICRLDLHNEPYTAPGAASPPTGDAYTDARVRAAALRLRCMQASGASKSAWTREQLSLNRPVVLGIRLPMGYPGNFLNPNFEWLNTRKAAIGNHCVLAIGYNDARQAIHIQDSRGPGSFDKGCWWMGYLVVDSGFVLDAYSLLS